MPGLSDVMRKLSMDILEDSDQDPHLNIDPDTQSTVSTMEDEPLISNTKSSKNSSSSSPPEKPKSVWNPVNDESFSNFKTFHHDDNVTQQDKEGFRGYYRRSPPSGHSRSSQLRDQSQRSSVLSANQRPGASHLDQSEQSSLPTTSDEEAERPNKRLVSDGDTSTMESAQAMGADR